MAALKQRPWGNIQPPSGASIDWGDPITNGLKGYWPLNEGGGYVANNLAGKNGTYTGNPTWVVGDQGTQGRSMRFDGTGDYVAVDNITLTDFTISCRARFVAGDGVLFGDNQAASKYMLYVDASTMYIAAGAASASHGGDRSVWNHWAVTRTGSAVTFWRNGKSLGGGTYATSLVLRTLAGYDTAFYINGFMKNAGCWNRGLNANEIRRISNEPFAGIVGPKLRIRSGTAAAPPAGNRRRRLLIGN